MQVDDDKFTEENPWILNRYILYKLYNICIIVPTQCSGKFINKIPPYIKDYNSQKWKIRNPL